MEVRVRSTGAVMLEDQLRRWLHETGGPSYETLTPEVMEAIGVDPVFEGPQASNGTVYQYSVRDGVEQGSDGKWYAKYVLGPVFTDNADGTAAQQEALYRARMDDEQASLVRLARNKKLADCDWTQLADSTADKPAWAVYRQALRDVTAQAGFPWNVTWPTEPGV
jgi:hypothetical protein